MEELATFTTLLTLLLAIISLFFVFKGTRYSKRVPPGSSGLPLIGESFDFLKALRDDKVKEWFQKRITKHGPIWKSHLFGYPTVVLHGPTANKFIYTYDGKILTSKHPPSMKKILGPNNLVELFGDDHKRVRAALTSFLKIEVLKQHVARVDKEIQQHLQMHWHGKHELEVQPLIKTVTFNVICSLLVGIDKGPTREKLLPHFQSMLEAFLTIPINLPFTLFNRGIRARNRMEAMIVDIIRKKKQTLEKEKHADTHKDLITSLLSVHENDSSLMMSIEEITDNIILVMIGGYDTTSTLVSLFIKLLANNESIYRAIVQEQEEIANSKASGEALTWEDLTNMKYTWRVASEILRMYPPVNLVFRRAMQDIEYGEFVIPKGWQVMLSQNMTHMDDSIFENPTVFDPARFEKHAPSPPPFSFVAFGAGPRMCPGMEFSKMETMVIIHRLVTQFKWELVNKDESFKRIPMIEFDEGLLIRVKPVK